MRSISSALVLAITLACCGGDNVILPPPDFGAPSQTFPAATVPLPQIVKGSGSVMTDVHVVPMFFTGDVDQGTFEEFLDKLANSPYWPQMVAEYGVTGPLVIDPSLAAGIAPTTGDEAVATIQTLLGSASADTLAHTIYLMHFTKDQLFSANGLGTSCETFAGFHSTIGQTMATDTPNAIVALAWGCDSSLLTIDNTDVATIVMTHELVEAATDPFPNSAWGNVDAADSAWALHFGGETGDMCEGFPRRIYRPDDLGFFIQRTWSNVQMTGFHDPCVPHIPGDGAFFATVPIQPDNDNGVDATDVPLDGSTTIDLDFLSDGPTGAEWIVEPIDETTLGGNAPDLEFTLDRNSGENGTKAHLTIAPSATAKKGLHPYRLLSTFGGIQNVWFGVVDLKLPAP